VVLSELFDIEGTLKLFNSTFVEVTFLINGVLLHPLFAAAFERLTEVFEAENPTAVGTETFLFLIGGHSVVVYSFRHHEKAFVHVYVENTEGEEDYNDAEEPLNNIQKTSSSRKPVEY
jgi:hypothetical protein